MQGKANSSIRSRRVSVELRRLRENAGMTGAQVAAILGMSPSKISRIETGSRGLDPEAVSALLGLYRVPERQRDGLLDLVRKTNDHNLWVSSTADLPDLWRDLVDFESRATRIQNFEPLVVPGLLQTPEYAAAIIGGLMPDLTDAELDRLVAARMSRQIRLRHRELQYLAVIDEAVLHRVIGDEGVMRRQLRHLVDTAERDNVTLRVVPMRVGTYAGLNGPFVTLEFDDEPDVAVLDNQAGDLALEEGADLAVVRVAWRNIVDSALNPAESVALIAEFADRAAAER